MEMNYNLEDSRLEILWQPLENGVRILRVFGQTQSLILPECIQGMPLVEVGPYCFSASERYGKLECHLSRMCYSQGKWVEDKDIQEITLPAICGNYMQEITLPDSVSTLANAAFYNCRKLTTLSVGSGIKAIGSDEFMNCHKLRKLILRCNSEEKSGLELILERITTEVEVHFQDCVVLFPEYYEWLDEVTPAHLFTRTVEGEGLRMRKACQGGLLDFAKYDQCFSTVLLREDGETVVKIAWLRLRHPKKLGDEAKLAYEEAIRERYAQLQALILQERNLEDLQFFCQYFQPEPGLLTEWMEACIQEDWGEGSAFLMEEKYRRGSFAEKKFDFDDFEDDW